MSQDINRYYRDIVEDAKKGKIKPIIGRDKEIDNIIKKLHFPVINVLIGKPGIGKTTIIEGLASRIANGNVPDYLQDKKILSLDINSLLQETYNKYDFIEKLKTILEKIKSSNGKIILFIDEIHTLCAGNKLPDDSIIALNLLAPYINNNEITVIGATTEEEYVKYIEVPHKPLLRRLRIFEPMYIEPLNKESLIQILISYITDLEKTYNLKLDINEASLHQILEYIIDIKNRHIMPPFSQEVILNSAFANATYNHKDKVSIDDIFFAMLNNFDPNKTNEFIDNINNHRNRT